MRSADGPVYVPVWTGLPAPTVADVETSVPLTRTCMLMARSVEALAYVNALREDRASVVSALSMDPTDGELLARLIALDAQIAYEARACGARLPRRRVTGPPRLAWPIRVERSY